MTDTYLSDISQWIILLVDDEPDSLNLLAEIVIGQGAEVHRASSGAECLALLQHLIPTAIVMDLSMPRPDGWEQIAAIRANPALDHTPVVAVTAFYSTSVEQEAYRAGFDAFLPKPVKVSTLIDQLQAVVGGRR